MQRIQRLTQHIVAPKITTLFPRSTSIPSLIPQFTRSISSAVNTKDAPGAIGPYSQGIKANGFLFVSGSLGLDPKTGEFPGKDITSQTKQSLDNIGAILKAGNSSFANVVKTTILLADMKDFPEVNKIYATYFRSPYPARATFAVKELPKGALVEIEAIATHS